MDYGKYFSGKQSVSFAKSRDAASAKNQKKHHTGWDTIPMTDAEFTRAVVTYPISQYSYADDSKRETLFDDIKMQKKPDIQRRQKYVTKIITEYLIYDIDKTEIGQKSAKDMALKLKRDGIKFAIIPQERNDTFQDKYRLFIFVRNSKNEKSLSQGVSVFEREMPGSTNIEKRREADSRIDSFRALSKSIADYLEIDRQYNPFPYSDMSHRFLPPVGDDILVYSQMEDTPLDIYLLRDKTKGYLDVIKEERKSLYVSEDKKIATGKSIGTWPWLRARNESSRYVDDNMLYSLDLQMLIFGHEKMQNIGEVEITRNKEEKKIEIKDPLRNLLLKNYIFGVDKATGLQYYIEHVSGERGGIATFYEQRGIASSHMDIVLDIKEKYSDADWIGKLTEKEEDVLYEAAQDTVVALKEIIKDNPAYYANLVSMVQELYKPNSLGKLEQAMRTRMNVKSLYFEPERNRFVFCETNPSTIDPGKIVDHTKIIEFPDDVFKEIYSGLPKIEDRDEVKIKKRKFDSFKELLGIGVKKT